MRMRKGSRFDSRDDADNRIFPLPNLALDDSKCSSNLILAHG